MRQLLVLFLAVGGVGVGESAGGREGRRGQANGEGGREEEIARGLRG